MNDATWIQLGLGGACVFVLYKVLMRIVDPFQRIANEVSQVRVDITNARLEVGRVHERLGAVEAKLTPVPFAVPRRDEWGEERTPVEIPRELSERRTEARALSGGRTDYVYTRAKTEPGKPR